MSQASIDVRKCTPTVLLDELSHEFGMMVHRLRDQWNDAPGREAASADQIEAAQLTVDRTASAMLEGACGRADWSLALSEYEKAWAQVFDSLGDRRN